MVRINTITAETSLLSEVDLLASLTYDELISILLVLLAQQRKVVLSKGTPSATVQGFFFSRNVV